MPIVIICIGYGYAFPVSADRRGLALQQEFQNLVCTDIDDGIRAINVPELVIAPVLRCFIVNGIEGIHAIAKRRFAPDIGEQGIGVYAVCVVESIKDEIDAVAVGCAEGFA